MTVEYFVPDERKSGGAYVTVTGRVRHVSLPERILVMEDGEVVGSGTHTELLDTCPTYQEICMSQMNAEEAGA